MYANSYGVFQFSITSLVSICCRYGKVKANLRFSIKHGETSRPVVSESRDKKKFSRNEKITLTECKYFRLILMYNFLHIRSLFERIYFISLFLL